MTPDWCVYVGRVAGVHTWHGRNPQALGYGFGREAPLRKLSDYSIVREGNPI
jgi:hypothetical protein